MKSTAGANYAHIRYIATRPRVMKNDGMKHGLFGKLQSGSRTEFKDWKEVAQLVYANSKRNITLYRSIISIEENVLKEIDLINQKQWQGYIEKHINTIAEKNKIKRENLGWVCAVHHERGHPHIHVAFWDKSSRVKNPFVPPAIPNAIRKQLIKDTFPLKILQFAKSKDMAVSDIRAITNELVEEFEKKLRLMDKKKYKAVRNAFDEEGELMDSFDFGDEILNTIADRVFHIKSKIPPKGRISYQLLPSEIKELVDDLVAYIIKNNDNMNQLVDAYVESKMQMVRLYGGSDDYLKKQCNKFTKEAEKIIANRILGMVKTLNRLDYENKTEEYQQKRKEYYTTQMLYEIMDMFRSIACHNNQKFEQFQKMANDLSKEAKKELYLKYQDKGYEH